MRDFSATTLKALAKRGIAVTGAQAAPAFDGDETLSGKVYKIVIDECLCLRTHAQVRELAR